MGDLTWQFPGQVVGWLSLLLAIANLVKMIVPLVLDTSWIPVVEEEDTKYPRRTYGVEEKPWPYWSLVPLVIRLAAETLHLILAFILIIGSRLGREPDFMFKTCKIWLLLTVLLLGVAVLEFILGVYWIEVLAALLLRCGFIFVIGNFLFELNIIL